MDADMPTTGKGPAANLAARRAAGQVHSDPVQEKVVGRLQAVHDQLLAMQKQPAKPGLLAWLGLTGATKPADGPHGLYIWGPVGRGKSMLMDLFFAASPVQAKRRVHFHAFMLEMQDRLHKLRGSGRSDPLMALAADMAQEAWLLCFDEFQVTDIADAMILGPAVRGAVPPRRRRGRDARTDRRTISTRTGCSATGSCPSSR
jgi:cell division protein ZapE